MFQPAPRRHRKLPTGTMVSYAEVKSYLSKREIPQLFESLMAGLMYHRPENHIGYLQTCLDEVKSNSETKVQWSTFVNAKKRKSKEILPPLTPKKQDSYSSSWSDNSRQSTPLPPISARTRIRASIEQQDFRNTYILYHNPPPILAKPKVPVISVLGGLGAKIDELCERVVGRLRGVVHISTCSMLKTRMTIEGFYRMTAVPACAVVDSVLQAMSMVQSANALLVAGFPRNRGDIEEYRSRRVRMDGVVLVDFEEEALRRFLEREVDNGCVRPSEIEAELERFKQDIISVAEYYDQKELLTVVMGDQDLEEIIDDLVLAVDKVIETRKDLPDEDAADVKNDRECDSSCKTLLPTPDKLERPSTVEIREVTEEEIKSIEEEAKKNGEALEIIDADKERDDGDTETQNDDPGTEKSGADEEPREESNKDGPQSMGADPKLQETAEIETNQKDELSGEMKEDGSEVEISSVNDETTPSEKVEPNVTNNDCNTAGEKPCPNEDPEINENDSTKPENLDSQPKEESDNSIKNENVSIKRIESESTNIRKENVPLIFSFENINIDYDEIKNMIANDLEMCFIDFEELMRNDGSTDDKFENEEAIKILGGILQQDSVSYSNGFFIFKYPLFLVSDNIISELLKLGDLCFVCRVVENKPESESDSEHPENKLFNSALIEKLKIIFVTEENVMNELRQALQDIVNNKKNVHIVQEPSQTEDGNVEKVSISDENVDACIKMDNDMEEQEKKDDGDQDNNSDKKEDEVKCEVIGNEEIIVDDRTNKDECEVIENEEIPVDERTHKDEYEVIENEEIPVDERTHKDECEVIENEEIPVDERTNKDECEVIENEEIPVDERTNKDECEDSTGRDVEDLISDDTLNEISKPTDSLKSEDDQDVMPEEVNDLHSQASSLASNATQKERAVLERQSGLETDGAKESEDSVEKVKIIRQSTYSADEVKEAEDEINENQEKTISGEEPENKLIEDQISDKPENPENETAAGENNEESTEHDNLTDEVQQPINLNEDSTEAHEKCDSKNGGDENVSQSKKEEQESQNSDVLNADEPNEDNTAEDINEENNAAVEISNISNDAQKSEEGCIENEQILTLNNVDDNSEKPEDENDHQNGENDIVHECSEGEVISNDSNQIEEQTKINASTTDIPNDEGQTEDIDAESQPHSGSEKHEEDEAKDETVKQDMSDNDNLECEKSDLVDNEKSDQDENTKNEETFRDLSADGVKPDENCETGQEYLEKNELLITTEQTSENRSVTDTEQQNDKDTEEIRKVIDDSDSNDENIVIETQAEVHATNCDSRNSEELESVKEPDSAKPEELEHSEANETGGTGDIIDIENETNEEDDAQTTEMTNNKEETGDINDNESKENEQNHSGTESVTKLTILENDESGGRIIDTVVTEKYSNKRQERNGSGILGESREEQQMESDEPQERSSSSSRGEL